MLAKVSIMEEVLAEHARKVSKARGRSPMTEKRSVNLVEGAENRERCDQARGV